MWLDFDVRDNRRWTFSLEEALLWIMDSYFSWKQWFEVKNLLMMDLFQLLASQDVNWWTGVVWISCGLLWCFLSAVWTLNLMAPIHCRASMVTHTQNSCFAFNPSKVHTHSSEHTHTVNTHPEQWAAIYAAAPGEQLGFGALLKGISRA